MQLIHAGKLPWGSETGSVSLDEGARLTSREALALAGLDFEVKPAAVFINGVEQGPVSTRYKALVRSDRPNAEPLAIVGKDYGIVQNREAFEVLDIASAEHGATIRTIGSSDGGRRIFALADLPDLTFRLRSDDEYRTQMMLVTGHDGKTSVIFRRVTFRLFCLNQLSALFAGRYDTAPATRIAHTRRAADRVRVVRDAVTGTIAYHQAMRETAERLSGAYMGFGDACDLADRLWPTITRATEHGPMPVVPAISANVVELFREQRTQDPNVADTRWGFYQATTAYLDHNRRGSARTRLGRALQGTDDRERGRVLQALAA